MRKLFLSLVLVTLSAVTFGPQWVAIKSDTPNTMQTTLVSSSENQITVNVQVPGFYTHEVTTPRGEANVISVPRTVSTAQAGEPDLPMIAIPAIIGDAQHYSIRVINAQYADYPMEIAPSKGDFSRQVNPEDVPYTYGEAYETDAFFPAENVGLYEPYILRDFRGQNMVVYPFAYNPVTHTLRVFYNMTVEMFSDGQQGENQLSRRSNAIKMDPEFDAIYANQFINYHEGLSKYTPMVETGELLIICHDAFMSAMEPFVNWKRQIGRPTTMVGTSTAGGTDSAIKAYIQSQYDTNNNLTHVLLVGDVAQIPGHYVSSGGYSGKSDNWYGQVAGNDYYNEIMVGRFSAEQESHVTTQVNKVIHYERDINASDTWLPVGGGVAAYAGSGGHFGEDDWQHINNIREDLLGYNYTMVYQDYQNVSGYTSSAAIMSQHYNEGVSIINYCNHGSPTSWGVFGYSNSNVNALTNVNKLPIIWSVACDNGKYDYSQPCFGETWLRANNNNDPTQPTGAIGGMFSYISQPWVPPMYGQDEMVDVLVESYTNQIKRTMGGCSYDGNMKILDQYGEGPGQGLGTYACWILFGDPTLTLRNAVPGNMNVTHASSISTSETSFTVNATNGEDALATLTRDNEIMGSATISNGTANITFSAPETTGTATLTVFGYNKITYVGTVEITGGGTQYYNVSVMANPTEGGIAEGDGAFQQGESCTVTATPNADYTFTNWMENDHVVSTQANYTFIVTDNRYLVANFTAIPQNYTVSVSANPTNGGTVTGGGTYQEGQSCTVTATPATGYTFVRWTENGNQVSTNANYTFTVTSNHTLVAQFQLQSYTISVSANPTNGGSVTGGGTYNYGQSCTLTATPTSDYTFVNWTKNGQQVSTNATYTFTVTESATYQANFQEIPCYAPSDLTAQAMGNTIVLSWQPSSTAVRYRVYRDDNCIANNVTSLTYTDSDLQFNHQYCYFVTAMCSNGNMSDPTNEACATTENFDCEAPTNVTAEAINYTDIYVNWTGTSTAQSYKIYRNGTLIASGYPYVGSYYDTELPYGEYCYTIVSECEYGDSEPSEEACAVLNIPCNAPAGFSAEYVYENETNFGVSLHWNSVAPIYPEFFHLYRQRNTTEYELVADLEPDGTSYSYFDDTETGIYSYMLTAEYHFDGQVCVSDPVYASVEVTDVNEASGTVSIYPNPTQGELTLEGEGLQSVRIVNVFGQTVYNAKVEGDQVRLDLSSFAKGIYMMHIDTVNGEAVRKIMVE